MLVSCRYLIGVHDVNNFVELSNLDIATMVGILFGAVAFVFESEE